MRAIILTAGFGNRLRPLTNDRPKSMVEFKGRTIIQRQIDIFKSIGISPIIIIGGHGFNSLKDLDCILLENIDYSKTNMVYSLLCARKYFDDDLIISYGDILYEPSILKNLIQSKRNISVAVDMNWRSYWEDRFDDPLSDAETLKLGKNGNLIEIGNKPKSFLDIDAQFMGLMKFKKKGMKYVLNLCDKINNKNDKSALSLNGKTVEVAYTTDLLNELIQKNISVRAVKVTGTWVEFDTIADYGSRVTEQRCDEIDRAIYAI